MAQWVQNLPAMKEMWVQSLGQEDLLEEKWQHSPVFLLEKSHGQRSLDGNSPKGHKESEMTERLSTHAQARPESRATANKCSW